MNNIYLTSGNPIVQQPQAPVSAPSYSNGGQYFPPSPMSFPVHQTSYTLAPEPAPQPVPKIHHRCQDANDYENVCTVIEPNYIENTMVEETIKNRGKIQFSRIHDNLSCIPSDISDDFEKRDVHSRRTLTKGIVEIESAFILQSSFPEFSKPFAVLNVIDANQAKKRVEIPAEILTHDKKALSHTLKHNGLIMKYSDSVEKIQEYLAEKYAKLSVHAEIRHDGFYIEDNCLHHSEETEIFKGAADSFEILDIFNLNDTKEGHPPYLNLTLMGTGCIASILTLLIKLGYNQMPLIVMTNSNPEKAAMELSKVFCDTNKPIKLSRGLKMSYTNKLTIIVSDNSYTDYMERTLLTGLIGLGSYSLEYAGEDIRIETLPVLVTSDIKAAHRQILGERFIEIPYTQTNINQNALRGFKWFQRMCLNQQDFLLSITEAAQKYKTERLEPYGCPEYRQDFYSLLLATTEKILLTIGYDAKQVSDIISGYTDYLLYASDSEKDAVSIIKDYLKQCAPNTLMPKTSITETKVHSSIIGYTDDNLLITSPAMQKIATESGMSQTELAKQLKSAGVLDCGDKYQKNVRISDGTYRFYALPYNRLFDIGQVRIQPDEFSYSPPALTVPIGMCGDVQINYSLDDLIGTENPHALVTGPSGSGKSYFLSKFGSEAARKGMAVIFLGTEITYPDTGENENRIILRKQSFDEEIITFGTILSPLMDLSDWTDSEKELLNMFVVEQERFKTVEQCVEVCHDLFSGEADGERILSRIDFTHCCGVYNTAYNWSRICMTGSVTKVIAKNDDTDFLNAILKSLFDYKCSQKETTPCLLVIDECQEFDLQQNSPLVKLILRQGRKYGIMAFLATQYLTADNGKNISKAIKQCDTIIAFKPGDNVDIVKLMGYSIKDEQARKAIADIDRYSCIVKGRISTDRCRINYPLILDIPK